MAQDTGSQNKTIEFLQNNPIYVIVGLLAVLTIVYFIATGGDNGNNDVAVDENTQETTGQNQPTENQPGTTPNGQDTETQDNGQVQGEGNIATKGTLRESDDAARGNLMVESSSGKVYVSTSRDFSSLVGKEVTLNAEGSLNSFRFLGFDDSKVAGTDTVATTDNAEASNVSFRGNLRKSDDSAKGNFVISSGNTHVYLITVRDYSAWVGQDVVLSATGSLNDFSNAILTK